MNIDQSELKTYRVKLGHAEVAVQCADAREAVRLARLKLADEMPRLYSVIHAMDEQRFRIDAVRD